MKTKGFGLGKGLVLAGIGALVIGGIANKLMKPKEKQSGKLITRNMRMKKSLTKKKIVKMIVKSNL